MLWVLIREDRRRTSPLKTHSWTGKSKSVLVNMMGFLLLSTDDGLPLMFFALSCCCCCSVEDLTDLWKALLDVKLLLVPFEMVSFEVSSCVSLNSSFLLALLWSFRMVRIFSPVMMVMMPYVTGLTNNFKLHHAKQTALKNWKIRFKPNSFNVFIWLLVILWRRNKYHRTCCSALLPTLAPC